MLLAAYCCEGHQIVAHAIAHGAVPVHAAGSRNALTGTLIACTALVGSKSPTQKSSDMNALAATYNPATKVPQKCPPRM